MTSLLRRWDCDDDDDCHHAFKSSVTMIIVIVVIIVVVKICLIIAICTCIKRRRSRALRPYQGGYPNGAATQPYNGGYGGGAEWTGAQVPSYPAQQAPPPPGYYEMDRSAPDAKGGDSGTHGDGGSHGASHGGSHA